MGLLVDRQNEAVRRRVEIEANHVAQLGRERRIGGCSLVFVDAEWACTAVAQIAPEMFRRLATNFYIETVARSAQGML